MLMHILLYRDDGGTCTSCLVELVSPRKRSEDDLSHRHGERGDD